MPRIDARPRECKCKITADPFFSRLSAPHCLHPTFLLPSHASPSISAFIPSSASCFPLLRARTDKLISSGKAARARALFSDPFSALRKKYVCLQFGTGNLILLVFFCIFPRMNMSLRFAFYFLSATDKTAPTLVRIKLRFEVIAERSFARSDIKR